MTTDTVELMQLIYQAELDVAELNAYGLGLKILICILLLWLCTIPARRT